MFVGVKNCTTKKFFFPRSKGPPRGQNGLKTHAPNDRENCQSVCCKVLIEGTQGFGIEPFQKKFENFPQMREREGPKNKILPKNLFFPIFKLFSFLNFAYIATFF